MNRQSFIRGVDMKLVWSYFLLFKNSWLETIYLFWKVFANISDTKYNSKL